MLIKKGVEGIDDDLVALGGGHEVKGFVDPGEWEAVGDHLLRIHEAGLHEPDRLGHGGGVRAEPRRPCASRKYVSPPSRQNCSWVVIPKTFHRVPRRRKSTIRRTASMGRPLPPPGRGRRG